MTPEDYSQLEAISRRSLWMYDITERERKVATVIIDFSFRRGRESAVIPQLQAFVNLTGLDKGDVSRALQRLQDRGIVQINGPREARVYAFIPSANFWLDRTPLYDVELAIETERELARINALPAGYEPTGQATNGLAADEPGLDDGIRDAARDDALEIGGSPIGKTPTTAAVGDSPMSLGLNKTAHARNVERNNVDNVNVADGESPKTERRFADPDHEHIFETLERFADSPDFRQYRPKWIRRVREHPGIVREGVGDARLYAANPQNKVASKGALVFRRCQMIARSLGKTFHLL